MEYNLKYNIMIQSDSFIVLNQAFLTDADDQNGKPNWLLSQLIYSGGKTKSKLAI